MAEIRPDIVVHAAALANVDACENDPEAARRLNVGMTENLLDAIAAECPTCRFVYVSSDQVYDGQGPHDEASPCPGNVYGRTKLEGEEVALKHPDSLVAVSRLPRNRTCSYRKFRPALALQGTLRI